MRWKFFGKLSYFFSVFGENDLWWNRDVFWKILEKLSFKNKSYF